MARLIVLTAALGAAVVGTATPAFSSRAATPLPAIEIPYERHVLPNGLTLIVHEDRFAPLVSVSAWHHVGGKDEPLGRTGFAHLFEHLNFPPGYSDTLADVGATANNAHTRNDYTNYFQTVPASALDTALWLEARRMGRMRDYYDQRTLDSEREIVEGEKRFVASRFPYAALETEMLWQETYPATHPYSRSGMGSSEDLNAATLDDVKQWYERWQGAANAVLVVAGNVHAAEVIQKVERYFGAVPPGPPVTRVKEWVAKMNGERRVTSVRREVSDARIYKVWNVPGYATRDFSMLELTAQILGDGANSRLRQRLVAKDRVASEVRVRLDGMELGSQLRISITLTDASHSAAAERALNEEMTTFLRDGPTPEELKRALVSNYSRVAAAVERLDSSGGKSWYLAVGEMYAGTPAFFRQALQWQQSATADDLRLSARQWLSDGAFVWVVQPEPAYRTVGSASIPDTAPAIDAPTAMSLPSLQRATLSNGLKVALLERGNTALTRMSLLVDGGASVDAKGQAGASKLTLRVLKEYADSLDPQRFGAHVDASTSLETSALSITTIGARLPDAIALLGKTLRSSNWRAVDLRKAQDALTGGAAQQRRPAIEVALQTFANAVSGGSQSYETAMAERIDATALQALTLEDVRNQQQRWLRPDNATLLIVGATSLAETLPLLEKQLVAWRAPALPTTTIQVERQSQTTGPQLRAMGTQPPKTGPELAATGPQPAKAGRIYLLDVPGAAQTEIIAGRLAGARGGQSYTAQEFLVDVLDTRLTDTLRESLNLTYDVAVSLQPAREASPLTLRTVVRADGTVTALKAIVKEMSALAGANPLAGDELARMQRKSILALPGRNESPGELLNSMSTVLNFALPDDYWNTHARRIEAISAEQLQSEAASLLAPASFSWVLMGEVAKLQAGLRELGLAEVVMLDDEGKVLR